MRQIDNITSEDVLKLKGMLGSSAPAQAQHPGWRNSSVRKYVADLKEQLRLANIDALQSEAHAQRLADAMKIDICERLGSVEKANEWAAMYRDGHAGRPDVGLIALIDALTEWSKQK